MEIVFGSWEAVEEEENCTLIRRQNSFNDNRISALTPDIDKVTIKHSDLTEVTVSVHEDEHKKDVIGGYGEAAEEKQELDLRRLFNIADSHNFFCPNCSACVTKLITLRVIRDLKTPPPIKDPSGGEREMPVEIPFHRPAIGQGPAVQGAWISSRLGFGAKKTEIPGGKAIPATGSENVNENHGIVTITNHINKMLILDGTRDLHLPPSTMSFDGHQNVGGAAATSLTAVIGGYGEEEERKELDLRRSLYKIADSHIFLCPNCRSCITKLLILRVIRGGKRQDILKTVVSIGLTESITSSSIVTAAANTKISNGNIVAFALTNLITGLFIIRHNVGGLKKNKMPKKGSNGYKQALVDGFHYLLHYTMALLSFLFFGLVPPVVYAFTFRETDSDNRKLIAVAGASFPCIALLAAGKTIIQTPKNYPAYAKTVFYYVFIEVVALGISYLAGFLFGELHGWFE